MFVITHFSVPFFSYYVSNRYLKTHESNKSLFVNSCFVGLAGLIPDFTDIHISLTARQNSFSHTIWSPALVLILSTIAVLLIKRIPKAFIFWLPFAVLIHLFLDGISGGIKIFYPSHILVGKYFISPLWWGVSDACFLSLLYVTYKKTFNKYPHKAEDYN